MIFEQCIQALNVQYYRLVFAIGRPVTLISQTEFCLFSQLSEMISLSSKCQSVRALPPGGHGKHWFQIS